ncbi:MAG: hypothetical protein CBB71_02660 [Rhodopirellula sp. TMED11]|nr:MAG: hypothetical protein CBB71_02660 [Rhodopirellula sp. TMED11]
MPIVKQIKAAALLYCYAAFYWLVTGEQPERQTPGHSPFLTATQEPELPPHSAAAKCTRCDAASQP